MNIILLSNFCKKKGSIDICVPRAAAWLLPGVAVFASLLLWTGYEAGVYHAEQNQSDQVADQLRGILQEERNTVETAKAEQRAHLDALALRIANIQAHLMRVDALGDRLVGIGKLDSEEFDFSVDPAVGGADQTATGDSLSVVDISTDMQRISGLLEDREVKLLMLEDQLLNRDLIHDALPSGRPVDKGWVSSGYGKRTDPFSGKKTYHRGVDFAGKRGTDVHTVAAGVIKRAKKVAGYGNVVEVRHADGFSTLYGHNQKLLVEAGDVVTKGQVIALLGSTGRSSGPHVHFEVHKNGKIVNPRSYIRAP